MSRRLLAVIVLALACGGRSATLGETGASSAGGASAIGAGGGQAGAMVAGGAGGGAPIAGASGGGGAAFVTCPDLASAYGAVPFAVSPGGSQIELSLAPLAGDELMGFSLVEPVLPSSSVLRVGTFVPWKPWPMGPVPSVPFAAIGAEQSALAPGHEAGTVALAFPVFPSPPAPFPSGLQLAASVSPTTALPLAPSVALDGGSASGEVPLFVTPSFDGHLVGHQPFANGHFQLDLAFVDGAPSIAWKVSKASCATSALVADGAALADGSVVVAFSASLPFGHCVPGEMEGMPSRLLLARWLGPPHALKAFGPALAVDGDRLAFVRVLPAPDGVWVAFRYAGLNAEAPPPVDVMRLTTAGKVVFGPVPITPASALSVAIAPLGDGLAVAWQDFAGDPAGTLHARSFDGALMPQAVTQVPRPPGLLTGRLALVTAPSGLDAIVGWVQEESAGARAYVSRLTCAFPD